jgi:hypothetical protein
LKHTHGHRKPRERYAPQGEFSQEETRPHRYGTKAGSTLDVLIVQSNYPEGLEGVPVIVPARGAKWAFSEIYGRLAALQAAGAAPIIQAWLAGELPVTFH